MGEKNWKDWRPFVYGGLASIVAELCTFPLDTTKTRLQVQGQKYDRKLARLRYSGMTDALLQISKQEGIKGLYSGISSAILRQATYGTIKFGTYYSLKKAVIDTWAIDDLFTINIVCAALAGAISSAIANPTDVVKVRMQVTGSVTNVSLFTCFQDVYKHEGIRGLWRGVGPTAQRAAVIAAVELPIYDYTKNKCMSILGNSISNHFVSSFAASMGSAVASTPIDVIRKFGSVPVKATMPLFTVALSRIILQEQQTWKVYLSLVPIVGGVAIATLTELSFNMIGLISALASTMAFSLQNIYSKKVLHETGIHHLRLLHILGRLALFMFSPIWGVYDLYRLIYEPMMRPSVEMSYYILGLLFLDGILNWFQNIIAFSVLSIVTPLTYAVASASKRIFVIAVTLLILGNPVTWLNIFGMTMAIIGVLCYNNAKYNQKLEKQKETILPKYYNPTQNGNNSSFMVNGFASKQYQSFAI